jgi:hypothetical protein
MLRTRFEALARGRPAQHGFAHAQRRPTRTARPNARIIVLHGFVTDIESDSLPPGPDEDVIREISRRKREPSFLLRWRIATFERWLTMSPPNWGKLRIAPIDFQPLSHYSAPKLLKDWP